MKTKKILLTCALGLSLASQAQWPSPLNLNTAVDVAGTGKITTIGNPDLNWSVTNGNINTGPYVQAVRVNGPGSGGWWTSTYATADWISYPHGCSSAIDPSESWCISPTTPYQHEEYYKVTVTLTNPGIYTLNWTGYADNCIYKIYLNGTGASNVVYSNPATSGYYTDMGHWNPVSGSISGWVVGVNTLYVHVKSGVNSSQPNSVMGNTGFLFKATGTYRSNDDPGGCCLGNLCTDTQNPLGGRLRDSPKRFQF